MLTVTPDIQRLQDIAGEVARDVLAVEAPRVDAEAAWPERSLRALASAGLLGLHVPRRLGGHEQGMAALVAVTEALARECPSTALCYGMHCVATAVVSAKATPDHENRYLRRIADGSLFLSLALSEGGTGVHFYWPQTHVTRDAGGYRVNGTKQFVTSGGFADAYVVTITNAAPGSGDAGEFSAVILDKDTPGMEWTGDWRGFGMRGNSSRALQLTDARVPHQQLLGREGDQVWYAFEVVAPYFLMAMSGVYVGIAAAALDEAIASVQWRQHAHTGQAIAAEPIVQHRLGELWIQATQAREFVHAAARLADMGDPGALPAILASKAAASTAAVDVANDALTLGGGRAYRENGRLTRMLRDARAGHVMAPPTDVLKLWLGRSLVGAPLL